MPLERQYDSADVLCISDFGWSTVGEDSMDLIEAEKRKGMVFYGLNVADGNGASRYDFDSWFDSIIPGSPESICDSLWEYCNGEVVKVNRKTG